MKVKQRLLLSLICLLLVGLVLTQALPAETDSRAGTDVQPNAAAASTRWLRIPTSSQEFAQFVNMEKVAKIEFDANSARLFIVRGNALTPVGPAPITDNNALTTLRQIVSDQAGPWVRMRQSDSSVGKFPRYANLNNTDVVSGVHPQSGVTVRLFSSGVDLGYVYAEEGLEKVRRIVSSN